MSKNKKSLAETHPELAKQWHPTLNGDLAPIDITSSSIKKVWWKCPKGEDHEFISRVGDLTRNDNKRRSCPICSGRKAVNSNSLQTLNPNLANEWHPLKNLDLKPNQVTPKMTKSVWWKCAKGEDHEWKSSIVHRVKGVGCPICSNHKIVKSNSLATLNPKISKLWHKEKNGILTPLNVGSGTLKKVWWKCPEGEDHEWQASVNHVVNGSGCPVCSNYKIVDSNCLETLNPQLANEWYPTKNNKLSPSIVGVGSAKKVWWKCSGGDDHEWQAQIASRHLGSGCPVCINKLIVKSNSLATLNPEIAKQLHPTKNGKLNSLNIGPGSHKKVWWKCEKGDDHIYSMSPENKTKGYGCPVCSGHKVVKSNSLATLNPDMAKQWHPTKNGKLTPFDVTPGSSKMIWWKCNKDVDHEWKTKPGSRTQHNSGCPFCTNQRLSRSNSLLIVNPILAKQWHPKLNGGLTPLDVTTGSVKKVWWKCEKGDDHVWEAMINYRHFGIGCPICSNHKIVKSNSLSTLNYDLAKQWHPTKNGKLTPLDVGIGSNKKVWWKCEKGDDHVWKTTVVSRRERGCPFCTLTPQSKQELTITFELMKLFKSIDPKGLKTKLEGRLRAIDIFIPKLNLCIEFDGSYWHKNKRDIDKIKSEMLFEEGFKLIRVREEPLKKIYDTDIISKQPYDGKKVTNDILSKILSLFDLDSTLVSKIKAYQSKEGLQNEKGLEKYIDKILTEKAENKR